MSDELKYGIILELESILRMCNPIFMRTFAPLIEFMKSIEYVEYVRAYARMSSFGKDWSTGRTVEIEHEAIECDEILINPECYMLESVEAERCYITRDGKKY
jgi:hypothetical protein